MSRYIDIDAIIEEAHRQGKSMVTVELLENMPTADVPQWIPCSERLPKYGEEVLCFTKSEEMVVGYLDDEWGRNVWTTGKFASGTFDALAWMPLPKPWKGEADGKDNTN